MTFVEAVGSVFRNYVNLAGRARRSEYWWFALFNVIVSVAAAVLDAVLREQAIQIVVGLLLILPGLAVTVRRLHDIDKSGWWVLIGLIPVVGFIWLLVLTCRDSQQGPNHYGDSPKYPGGGWAANPAVA